MLHYKSIINIKRIKSIKTITLNNIIKASSSSPAKHGVN